MVVGHSWPSNHIAIDSHTELYMHSAMTQPDLGGEATMLLEIKDAIGMPKVMDPATAKTAL